MAWATTDPSISRNSGLTDSNANPTVRFITQPLSQTTRTGTTIVPSVRLIESPTRSLRHCESSTRSPSALRSITRP